LPPRQQYKNPSTYQPFRFPPPPQQQLGFPPPQLQ
jgi:hypothetical protein